MRIVVTGGSGFIGRRLAERLIAAGHELHLLGRTPKKGLPGAAAFSTWAPETSPAPVAVLEGADAVIHLAGEPVAQRWTLGAKRRIRESRGLGTANLVRGIEQTRQRPSVLISGSAIGYYGDRGDEELRENSGAGTGFLADVTLEWEKTAMAAQPLGVRVVLLRTGMVLGEQGGALAKMLVPFKLGVGGRIGSGEQWMSWIHLDDVAGLVEMALNQAAISGPMNVTSNAPLKNAQFTAELARALKRPAFLPIPVTALKLLYGEMAEVLTISQRVLPAVALKAGYKFRYPKLGPALEQILAAQG